MSRAFLAFGGLLLIAFILTGQHLMRVVEPAHAGDISTRMMMRAYHIYILLAALLAVCAALVEAPAGWRRKALGMGRLLIASAGLAFLAGYFFEYGRGMDGRVLALPGSIMALLGGVALVTARFPFP